MVEATGTVLGLLLRPFPGPPEPHRGHGALLPPPWLLTGLVGRSDSRHHRLQHSNRGHQRRTQRASRRFIGLENFPRPQTRANPRRPERAVRRLTPARSLPANYPTRQPRFVRPNESGPWPSIRARKPRRDSNPRPQTTYQVGALSAELLGHEVLIGPSPDNESTDHDHGDDAVSPLQYPCHALITSPKESTCHRPTNSLADVLAGRAAARE